LTGSHRLALAALLAAHVALAVLAGRELPLWEPVDELAAVRQAQALGGAAAEGEAPQPLASRALDALGLRLLGLQHVAFLARSHPGGTPRDPSRWLHGPDEQPPFLGPARGLHELRWLSAACSALAVLAGFAIARRLLPARPGAALLAAALAGFSPPLLAAGGAIGATALQAAMLGAALAGLAALAGGATPTTRRALGTGALLGAARLAGAPLLVLLPLAPLALLLRRGAGGWRARLAPLDRLAAGFLVVAGPELAWRWTHAAPLLPAASPAAGALLTRWLPLLAWGHVARTAPGVALGPLALLAWSSLAALAAVGLVRAAWRARRTPEPLDVRVAALLLAALLLAAADSLVAALHGRVPDGRDLLPVGGALAALLAAGLRELLPSVATRAGAVLGLLIAAGLAGVAAQHELDELGPAFRPLNRVQDPHLLCFDPLADVPEAQHLATVRVLEPADGAQLGAPPVLRWQPVRTPDTRYSVHVSAPGAAWSQRSFEDQGLSFHDRYDVPATIWDALPPDVDLELRVVRLPALDEALGGETLFVDESRPIRVRKG
jgi:hypothetical protein